MSRPEHVHYNTGFSAHSGFISFDLPIILPVIQFLAKNSKMKKINETFCSSLLHTVDSSDRLLFLPPSGLTVPHHLTSQYFSPKTDITPLGKGWNRFMMKKFLLCASRAPQVNPHGLTFRCQSSLLTSFYSVLVSVSVFVALSTVFHSRKSPDNCPLCSPGLISALLVLSAMFSLYESLLQPLM